MLQLRLEYLSFQLRELRVLLDLGSKVSSTVLGTTYSSTLNLDYVAVPVMFQYGRR
jgi:hypothetical protein